MVEGEDEYPELKQNFYKFCKREQIFQIRK